MRSEHDKTSGLSYFTFLFNVWKGKKRTIIRLGASLTTKNIIIIMVFN